MAVQLRNYQQDMIDRLRGSLASNKRVLLQAPTGSGKTVLAIHMMQRAFDRGRGSFFLVHQNELLKQTSSAMWRHRLQHGMIIPGRKPSSVPVQVASVQTLVRRLDKYDPPDLIIIDEAHRSVANSYMKIVDAYPNAHVVGLTATPQRTDGRGLNEMFEDLVRGPEIRWLIDHGWLADYKIVAPPVEFDISRAKIRGGDFDATSLEQEMNKPTITADAIDEYRKHADGKRCVVMCVNIKHARAVAAQYRAAGIPAASIEGEMSGKERDKVLEDFGAGKLKIVTNVQLLIEGVDIPAIEAIQWLRPTQSLVVWMQANGRTLRPHASKPHAIIMDHVRNWARHDLPDEVRKWSLEARDIKARSPKEPEEDPVNTSQCPSCFAVFMRGPTHCPACGEALPRKAIDLPEQVDGELVEIEREKARKARRIEQGIARSIEDLVMVGFRRKMKRPAEWAAIVYARRQNRKPGPDDFRAAKAALDSILTGNIFDDGLIF